MSIAQTNQVGGQGKDRRGDVASLGSVLAALPRIEAEGLCEIRQLSDEADRVRYGLEIEGLRHQFKPLGDAAAGRRRKRKILNIIESFTRRTPITVDIEAVVWRDLYAVGTKIAGNDEHWDSACGPLMCASNAKLKEVLGWSSARHNITRLVKRGLFVEYNLAANGKRWFAKGGKDQDPEASGYSLVPLLLMEDYLDELAAAEERVAQQFKTIPASIRTLSAKTNRVLRAFAEDSDWTEKARRIVQNICKARKTFSGRASSRATLTALRRLERAAKRLFEVVGRRFKVADGAAAPEKNDTRVEPSLHHQYNPDSSLVSVDGLAERRSGNDLPGLAADFGSERAEEQEECSVQDKADDEDDLFGIERSGFQWHEAPTLFPFIDGLLPFNRGPGLDELHQLARAIGVPQASAARASGTLGVEVALLCILITGWHHSEGKIRKTPDAYLNALVKRARSGELNIGHTLFGRREAMLGKRETNGPVSVNHKRRMH